MKNNIKSENKITRKHSMIYNGIYLLILLFETISGISAAAVCIIMIKEIVGNREADYTRFISEFPRIKNVIGYWGITIFTCIGNVIRSTCYISLLISHDSKCWRRMCVMGTILLGIVVLEGISEMLFLNMNLEGTVRNFIFLSPYLLFGLYQRKVNEKIGDVKRL